MGEERDRGAVLDREAVVAALRGAGCVFAEEEAELLMTCAATPTRLVSLVTARVAGSPLEHLLGFVEFAGLRLAVGPGVFVPRQRTLLMVREAAGRLRPGDTLADLCCGCGAVAAAVARRVADLRLYAADLAPAAVDHARRNLPGAEVFQGDLYAALPGRLRGGVDVITGNAPYVPSEAIALMPPEARDHEPRSALDGGPDGLDLVRRLAADASTWLRPGGYLLVETGTEQADAAAAAFAGHGLDPRVVHDDELGGTVVIGRHGPAGERSRT